MSTLADARALMSPCHQLSLDALLSSNSICTKNSFKVVFIFGDRNSALESIECCFSTNFDSCVQISIILKIYFMKCNAQGSYEIETEVFQL